MTLLHFDSVSTIYDCARLAELRVHNIDHEALRSFSLSLREFERSLGDIAEDDYWKPFLRSLRRYRFETLSTPLPFNDAMGQNPDLIELLRGHLAHCRSVFPRFASHAYEVIDRLVALRDSVSNPILTTCTDIAEEGDGRLAILIKQPKLIPLVERTLGKEFTFRAFEVISSAQLRGNLCYSDLIVVGPARWHEDYVFGSPRAYRIHIVRYKWVSDTLPSREVFIGSQKKLDSGSSDFGEAVGAASSTRQTTTGSNLTPEDLLPSIDWDDVRRIVSARSGGHSEQTDADEEIATARLFQLEGDLVIPLDSTEGSTETVLDLHDEEVSAVRRMSVSDIQPGMYLLIRKGGGGEYILPVADRILGVHSERARELQREWKSRLRVRVQEDGLHQVIRQLKGHGSIRANQANVRNWMLYRSIKTENPGDFRAVLELTGLSHCFDEYWDAMTLIDSAHRRAGQFIRRRLLAEVQKADFRVLEKFGQMDFDLPEDADVNLTAIRVRSIHWQTIEIGVARLRRPLEADGNLWLG